MFDSTMVQITKIQNGVILEIKVFDKTFELKKEKRERDIKELKQIEFEFWNVVFVEVIDYRLESILHNTVLRMTLCCVFGSNGGLSRCFLMCNQ